jgi:hypothetical protein
MSRATGFLRDRAKQFVVGKYEILCVFCSGPLSWAFHKGEWGVRAELGWFGVTIRDASHPGYKRWKQIAQEAAARYRARTGVT